MSYESPIKIIADELKTKMEGDVMTTIQSYDITVDKEALLKALEYDRNQYEEGYRDGYNDAVAEVKASLSEKLIDVLREVRGEKNVE